LIYPRHHLTHNSFGLIGVAGTNHQRSLILRRQSTELEGLVADLHKMLGRTGWRNEGGKARRGNRSASPARGGLIALSPFGWAWGQGPGLPCLTAARGRRQQRGDDGRPGA
jgi:hypothetical protein